MIVDNHICFCTGRGLEIYDITDAANPQMLGTAGTFGIATSLAISGNYAYVADQFNGLCIYDISDQANPFLVGHYASDGCTEYVTVQDTLAYLADGERGLVILNILDSSNPYFLGNWTEPDFYAFMVNVADTIAYVTSISIDPVNGEPLRIINVADPTNPHLISTFPHNPSPGGNIIASCVDDTLSYLAGSWQVTSNHSHFLVANVADPANPVLVSNMSLGEAALGVTVSGDYAYVSTQGEGVKIIDISNPVVPVQVSYFDEWIEWGRGCAINDSILVVPHGYEGFSIIDISTLAYPVLLYRKSNFLHTVLEIEHYQRQLYLSSYINTNYSFHKRLQFIDVSDLVAPVVWSELNFLGRWNLGTQGPGLVVDYPYLTFALCRGMDGFLGVLDIDEITQPELVRFEAGTLAGPMAFAYPLVYAGYQDKLIIGDASTTPFWIDTIALPEYCHGMTIDDSLGHVACEYNLVILNLNTNSEIATYHHGRRYAGCNGGIVVDNPHLYLSFVEFSPGGIYNGFLVFDVTNPNNPSLLSEITTLEPTPWYIVVGHAKSCYLDDTLFYLCRGTAGFNVYDVSNAAVPILIATQDTPYSCDDIHVLSDTILVMDELSIEVYYLSGTGIEENPSTKDKTGLSVIEAHPDPFKNNVTITYDLRNLTNKRELAMCCVNIYDVSGGLVKSIGNLLDLSGQITWSGKDDAGRELPQGVYFVRLETDDECDVEKVVLAR
jgi:hypothetical protein